MDYGYSLSGMGLTPHFEWRRTPANRRCDGTTTGSVGKLGGQPHDSEWLDEEFEVSISVRRSLGRLDYPWIGAPRYPRRATLNLADLPKVLCPQNDLGNLR